MALLDSIVASWKLNESSGNAASEVGGFTLTNNNSVAYSAGKIGNAADGGATNTNKTLTITNNLGITGGAITMAGWVNVTTAPSDAAQCFFRQKDSGPADVAYWIRYRDVAGAKTLVFIRDRYGVASEAITVTQTL